MIVSDRIFLSLFTFSSSFCFSLFSFMSYFYPLHRIPEAFHFPENNFLKFYFYLL